MRRSDKRSSDLYMHGPRLLQGHMFNRWSTNANQTLIEYLHISGQFWSQAVCMSIYIYIDVLMHLASCIPAFLVIGFCSLWHVQFFKVSSGDLVDKITGESSPRRLVASSRWTHWVRNSLHFFCRFDQLENPPCCLLHKPFPLQLNTAMEDYGSHGPI